MQKDYAKEPGSLETVVYHDSIVPVFVFNFLEKDKAVIYNDAD